MTSAIFEQDEENIEHLAYHNVETFAAERYLTISRWSCELKVISTSPTARLMKAVT